MATIEHLIRNLKAVNFNEVIEEAVDLTRDDLARYQRFQMLKGENVDGEKIGVYKSKAYAARKHALSPLAGFGNVDLRLTGDFYKAMIIDPRKNSVVIDSADVKTERLIEKYGEGIFGLNPETAGEYATNHMGPVATGIIKKQIHK